MKIVAGRLGVFVLAAVALIGGAGAANAADDYPNHPVRWLVGYPPGGSTDICARLIGQYLSEHLGQQFAHREQAGRRQQSRDRNGGEVVARRLHRVPGQSGQCDQRIALQKPVVQFHPGYGAGRRLHPRAERDGNQPERPGQDSRRVHRLRQSQSRQDQHGLFGHRHLGPSVRRVVHDDDRDRSDPCALSRRGAGAHRYARRTGAGDVRQSAVLDRPYPGRPVTRACGDDRGPREIIAGRADDRRDRTGL